MAYPAKYYQMQQAVMRDIGFNVRTGLCPVCRVRPSATWPDGKSRITCNARTCFNQWLPIHTKDQDNAHPA